jgi:hypothetical protein
MKNILKKSILCQNGQEKQKNKINSPKIGGESSVMQCIPTAG